MASLAQDPANVTTETPSADVPSIAASYLRVAERYEAMARNADLERNTARAANQRDAATTYRALAAAARL